MKHLGILIGRSVADNSPDISPYFLWNNPGPLTHNPRRKVSGFVDLEGGHHGRFPVCVLLVASAWVCIEELRTGLKAARLTEAEKWHVVKRCFGIEMAINSSIK